MAKVIRLQTANGDNLYRWSGERYGNGMPTWVESFVKDGECRAITGRWLLCPNANVAILLTKAIK